ncbi:MAG: putative 2OG-Fe(II) oxygenase, partial [Gammaproteobacteria bacterium]|nr:putative 2OG-Fe(II) oxygenase [Gammaproteobacteria bacterium]
AISLYRQLRELDPQSVAGRYGFGIVQLETGAAAEAEALFDALILEGTDRPAISFMRGRARLELGKFDAALADLQSSHATGPTTLSFRALANQYWMRGQDEQFTTLIESSVKYPELIPAAAEALRQSGRPEAGLAHLGSLPADFAATADSAGVTSMCEIDCGEANRAELSARSCVEAGAANPAVIAALIVSLLMQGRAEQALAEIQRQRAAEPLGQHWIAYEATAYQLLGSAQYEQLAEPNDIVRVYELPTPRGFKNMESFNDEFARRLAKYHRYQRRPLDQSLRHGTQSYRNLVNIDDPVFNAYFSALDEPISDYIDHLGKSTGHPLSMRNTGRYGIVDCWSVRLEAAGYHTDHVHPKGWISSAYYVSVPDSSSAGDTGNEGSIRFGRPPFPTQPEISAGRWVQPQPGMVVLFPSYLWHGTEPTSDGGRVTAPFDVLPA